VTRCSKSSVGDCAWIIPRYSAGTPVGVGASSLEEIGRGLYVA
jgi:hypothetical protein